LHTPERPNYGGYLERYSKMVTSSHTGAVLSIEGGSPWRQ